MAIDFSQPGWTPELRKQWEERNHWVVNYPGDPYTYKRVEEMAQIEQRAAEGGGVVAQPTPTPTPTPTPRPAPAPARVVLPPPAAQVVTPPPPPPPPARSATPVTDQPVSADELAMAGQPRRAPFPAPYIPIAPTGPAPYIPRPRPVSSRSATPVTDQPVSADELAMHPTASAWNRAPFPAPDWNRPRVPSETVQGLDTARKRILGEYDDSSLALGGRRVDPNYDDSALALGGRRVDPTYDHSALPLGSRRVVPT